MTELDLIKQNLKIWAKKLLVNHSLNRELQLNIDDVKSHAPRWHEFGIYTHTLKVLEVFENELINILSDNHYKKINKYFRTESVDGKSKYELFKIAIILHDIGKWERKIIYKDGSWRPDYGGHELIGKQIIEGSHDFTEVNQFLKKYGFSKKQIEYISNCVGLHFKLGDIRKIIKEASGLTYNIDSQNSDEFLNLCKSIIEENNQYKIEIGVFFLVDNVGKVQTYITAETDESLAIIKNEVSAILTSQGKIELLESYTETAIVINLIKKYLNLVF